MSAILKPAMRRAWPRQKIPGALYHDFVRGEHAVNGVRDDLENIWTYTNGDAPRWGWVRGSDGKPVLKKFAAGEARRNIIDPATGRFIGYLPEGQATNELLDNRDPSTGNWVTTNSVTKSQNAVGADGEVNAAWTLTANSGDAFDSLSQEVSISDDSAAHTQSVLIGKDSDQTRFPALDIRVEGGTTEIRHTVTLNTETGAIADDAADGTSSVKDCGDFWRLSVSITNNGTGNTTIDYRVYPAYGTTLGSPSSSATGSIVYDFGQVELNSSSATSPIETGASAVTRNADDAREALSISDFVYVVEAIVPPDSDSERDLVSFYDGTNHIRVVRNPNTNMNISGNVISNLGLGSVSSGDKVKVALAVDGTSIRISLDGDTPDTRTMSTSFGSITKYTGQLHTGDRQWNEAIALGKLYNNPADWTNADLVEASKL